MSGESLHKYVRAPFDAPEAGKDVCIDMHKPFTAKRRKLIKHIIA